MPQWRADYFDNKDDKHPAYSDLIDANDENEAANKAAAKPGGGSE
jgi:hypothetical protein